MPDRPADRPEEDEPAPRPPAVPPGRPPKPPIVPPVAKPVAPAVVPPVARPVVPPVVPPVAKPVVPPAVKPVAPAAVPPVARPVVPPVQPPVVRPAAPPVLPPVSPPVQAPVVAPVQAPVLKPVAAPPPVVKPAAAPPVVKPAAGPGRPARGEAREPRGRGRESARAGGGGMGLGPKVGLLTGLLTALALAIAVLPGMKSAGGDREEDAFRTAGLNTVSAFASGLSGTVAAAPASGPAPASKAIEMLAADLEAQVKDLSLGGSARTRLNAVTGALKSAAAGRPVGDDLKKLVDEVTADLVKAQNEKDEDRAAPLRQQRERLLRLQDELDRAAGSPQPAAAPDRAGRLARPSSAGGYEVLAAWLRAGGDKGRVVARSDGAPDLPAAPAGADRMVGSFETSLGSRAATIFHSPAGSAGTAFVAFATPTFGGGGGGAGGLGLVMLILGPLLVGGLGWMLASAHGKPIRALARELDRLGSTGDPGRRVSAHGPEANAIARSVERMVANLRFRSQHEMADLQEVIEKEQGMAAQIHLGLMPKNPPRIPAWEVETLFKPGFEIGGDHFDYFGIDETHLGVIIMDASVRGVGAAIVMSMARAYVHAVAPGVLSPAEVLVRVNRLLATDLSQGQYVTALYVVIDTESGTAKVASAGHLPLVVFRSGLGKTAIVNPEGIALGLDTGPVFDRSLTEVDVDIGAGDRLVLHTDGALKVQSETGEEFGERRLYETIQQKAPMNSQAFVNFVGGAIDAFHLNTPQNDDITISTVKRLR